MTCRVLVVEDEIFVAIEIEEVVLELGYRPVGIAADSQTALQLGEEAEVAVVDLNLVDGPTGIHVGKALADRGVSVLFMTANPTQLGSGVPGAIGVLPKPASNGELKQALEFLVARRTSRDDVQAPRHLRLFADNSNAIDSQGAATA